MRCRQPSVGYKNFFVGELKQQFCLINIIYEHTICGLKKFYIFLRVVVNLHIQLLLSKIFSIFWTPLSNFSNLTESQNFPHIFGVQGHSGARIFLRLNSGLTWIPTKFRQSDGASYSTGIFHFLLTLSLSQVNQKF